jgi:hypothetical protein
VDESSAETKATGIKKTIAAKRKKKISSEPKSAVVGKFRMLSIAPVISSTRAATEIFSEDLVCMYNRPVVGKKKGHYNRNV